MSFCTYVLMYIHIQANTTKANSEPTQISQGSSANNFYHVPSSKTSPTSLFLTNNIKLNGIPSKITRRYVTRYLPICLLLALLHQLLHQQIFFVNFLELIQNYLGDLCHKDVVKTSLTPTPSTANCLAQQKFFIDTP